jgi:hypothetical protein
MLLLAIRFLAELAGIAALVLVGATAPVQPWLRVVLAIGGPAVLALAWATVVAPRAVNPVPQQVRQLIGTGLLLVVAGLLVATGHPEWGIGYAAVVAIDQLLIIALHPDRQETGAGADAAHGRS